MTYIPQIQPWFDHSETEALIEVMESTFITEHKKTKAFEEAMAHLAGSKYAIAYANGTLALAAALMAMELQPGDEVIVPDLTFIATANAVILAGGKPVFCDIGPDWQINTETISKKIGPKTKGIIPVHLYGQAADMPAILDLAKQHGLFVIEDAAQGVGVRLNGQHVGTFAPIGMVSFYGNKTITTAEGAIVFTQDPVLAEKMYRLKNHGRKEKGIFKHDTLGYNFSFTDLQAALGLAQLKKLPEIIRRKQALLDYYYAGLSNLVSSEKLRLPSFHPNLQPVHWFTSIEVPDPEALGIYLESQEIGSRRFFYPLHRQPCYVPGNEADFPSTVHAYEHMISLPSSATLTPEDQDRVIAALQNFFKT